MQAPISNNITFPSRFMHYFENIYVPMHIFKQEDLKSYCKPCTSFSGNKSQIETI